MSRTVTSLAPQPRGLHTSLRSEAKLRLREAIQSWYVLFQLCPEGPERNRAAAIYTALYEAERLEL